MPETLVCLRETQVREPPGEILLIPFGKVEYTKDNKVGSFNFDSESAQKSSRNSANGDAISSLITSIRPSAENRLPPQAGSKNWS